MDVLQASLLRREDRARLVRGRGEGEVGLGEGGKNEDNKYFDLLSNT